MSTEHNGQQLFRGRGRNPVRERYRRGQTISWLASDGHSTKVTGIALSFRLDGLIAGVQRTDPETGKPAWVWSYGEYVPDNELHIVPFKAILEPEE